MRSDIRRRQNWVIESLPLGLYSLALGGRPESGPPTGKTNSCNFWLVPSTSPRVCLENLSHSWFCGRKATDPEHRDALESLDLVEFRPFHFVSAIVSVVYAYL
jgi:hypothetical protein